MNIDDYEKKYFSIYEAFAETVRFILEKALLAAENLHRPQSIQCRAKGIESLWRRLADAGKLDTQSLELDRRDLAGARLIFYTNNDVDRFLASPLILEISTSMRTRPRSTTPAWKTAGRDTAQFTTRSGFVRIAYVFQSMRGSLACAAKFRSRPF